MFKFLPPIALSKVSDDARSEPKSAGLKYTMFYIKAKALHWLYIIQLDTRKISDYEIKYSELLYELLITLSN